MEKFVGRRTFCPGRRAERPARRHPELPLIEGALWRSRYDLRLHMDTGQRFRMRAGDDRG